MENNKLTIWVPSAVLEKAKRYADEHQTTLTRLVLEYLSRLTVENDPLADAPIVRHLSASLSLDALADSYRQYLEEKYGRQVGSD